MYNTAKYMPLKQGAISNFVVPCVNLEKLGNHSNQKWSRKKKHSKTLAIMITNIYCNYNQQLGLQPFQTEAAVHQFIKSSIVVEIDRSRGLLSTTVPAVEAR